MPYYSYNTRSECIKLVQEVAPYFLFMLRKHFDVGLPLRQERLLLFFFPYGLIEVVSEHLKWVESRLEELQIFLYKILKAVDPTMVRDRVCKNSSTHKCLKRNKINIRKLQNIYLTVSL